MIFESLNDLPTQWRAPDLCIIGAGAAGLTLAQTFLKERKLRILLLEAGHRSFDRKVQSLYAGKQSGDRHAPLIRARFAGLGGSTRIWAGWCRPLEPYDFSERPHYKVPAWPIPRSDLEPWFSQAAQICDLKSDSFARHDWEDSFPGNPLADGPGESAEFLEQLVFQVRRLDFSEHYSETVAQSEHIHLLLKAPVLALQERTDNPGQYGVEIHHQDEREKLLPNKIVLACGGMETPRLLMLSRNRHGQAPGNAGGALGRYFTEHGFADPGWFIPADRQRDMRYYFPPEAGRGMARAARHHALARPVLALPESLQRQEGLLNALMYFYPAYESHPDFSHPAVRAALELWEVLKGQGIPMQLLPEIRKALSAPHRVLHALWRQKTVPLSPQPRWRLRVYFECIPHPDNHMILGAEKDALDRPQIHLKWRLQDADLESAHRSCLHMSQILKLRGEGHLELPESAGDWRSLTECGKHPMGATRMSHAETSGVVDTHCRVFGTENLYVAGSSVFPSVGCANPTLTIVALTLRLAEHLKQNMSAC